jgi:hypothetical protein
MELSFMTLAELWPHDAVEGARRLVVDEGHVYISPDKIGDKLSRDMVVALDREAGMDRCTDPNEQLSVFYKIELQP